jgi:(1->4)-alpha-D-glucan 1-alpha-D-glucosylmutase
MTRFEGCRIPSSTYRLQVTATFTVRHLIELIPYLQSLGIGAVYSSPILKARQGSGHGYDVVDHGHLNPEGSSAGSFSEQASA